MLIILWFVLPLHWRFGSDSRSTYGPSTKKSIYIKISGQSSSMRSNV